MAENTVKKRPKTVVPRKAPKQARARETCYRILEGTRRLLEEQGAAAITTRNIAESSGVNIASIYQYYPNKQAILYALNQERLSVVIGVFDEFDTEEYLNKSPVQYFAGLTSAIAKLKWYGKADLELDKAIEHDAKLSEMMDRHTETVVSRLVALLRHFGCKWPDEKLRHYAEYIYEVSNVATRLRNQDATHSAPYTLQWEQDHAQYLIRYCLSD